LSKIWLAVKYGLAVALVLLAFLIGLGWYLSSSREAARKSSPFIQKLEQTEREKGDILKLLFDGMGTASEQEAKLVVDWLMPRRHSGEYPYLYIVGMYLGKQNDNRHKMQAIEYLAKAALVYRVDAVKCGDPTAHQAVPIFESALGMKMVRDSLRAKPDVRQRVVADALAFEEQSTGRGRPEWICLHGIKPGSAAPAEDVLRAHRHKAREQFQGTF
jgi:hypothetical protein